MHTAVSSKVKHSAAKEAEGPTGSPVQVINGVLSSPGTVWDSPEIKGLGDWGSHQLLESFPLCDPLSSDPGLWPLPAPTALQTPGRGRMRGKDGSGSCLVTEGEWSRRATTSHPGQPLTAGSDSGTQTRLVAPFERAPDSLGGEKRL